MPRRKAVDRDVPSRRRSRTGCKTCRARKVKCDEAKPRCSVCVALSLPCELQIQLKWECEFADRGLAFGRKAVLSKRLGHAATSRTPVPRPALYCNYLSIESYHLMNTSAAYFETQSAQSEEDCHEAPVAAVQIRTVNEGSRMSITVAHPTLFFHSGDVHTSPALSPTYSSPDEFDSSLLEYYFFRLCPMTSLSQTIVSPFAELVLPLFARGGQGPTHLRKAPSFRDFRCHVWLRLV
ncbi:Fc.00g106250.m01.CDS01 [Cosmosporella sp. VM-42]